MMRPMGVVSKKDCGVWSLLVRRLWCSFLAAPMFPMARVKEDTMTSRPEGGGGGGEGGGGGPEEVEQREEKLEREI